MAAIDNSFTEQNTAQTTTSTSYTDITGASIASGNFTTDDKYLLFVTAHGSNDTAESGWGVQVVHGSTAFAESDAPRRTDNINEKVVYSWFHVWTAISGEEIKLQFRAITSGTITVDQIAIFAMNLSNDVTENTDWFFNERATNDSLSTTPVDGGSVTFTPGTTGEDWLVATYALIDAPDGGDNNQSTLDRSGEAASALPSVIVQSGVANTFDVQLATQRVFNLGTSSNTFKEISVADQTGNTRLHSKVFVLNLSKFNNHSNAYTEADVSLSSTDYATELQSISITPTVTSDVWIGGFYRFDINNSGRETEFRIQTGGSDTPPGQTTDNYQFSTGSSASGEEPIGLITHDNLDTSTHTIDLDASADDTGGPPEGGQRTLWAVTMELPAAAGLSDPSPTDQLRQSGGMIGASWL